METQAVTGLKADFVQLAGHLKEDAAAVAAGQSWYRAGLDEIVSEGMAALNRVYDVLNKLRDIAKDRDISEPLRAQRLRDALAYAETMPAACVKTVQTAATQLRVELDKKLIPARPKDASDALLLDRKNDLTALLNMQPSPDTVTQTALKLAKEARAQGDALTFYVLAGGALHFYFQRRGADEAFLMGQFAELSDPALSPLLARFKGKRSIPALVTLLENAIDIQLTPELANYHAYEKSIEAAISDAGTLARLHPTTAR